MRVCGLSFKTVSLLGRGWLACTANLEEDTLSALKYIRYQIFILSNFELSCCASKGDGSGHNNTV